MTTQYEALAAIKAFADTHVDERFASRTSSWLSLHGRMEAAYWAARPSDDRQAALVAALAAGRAWIDHATAIAQVSGYTPVTF